MDGIQVAGNVLELDSKRLRAIADRLTVASGSLDKIAAAADEGAAELRRLADGFDMLREVARQEREAAAAVVGGYVAAIQATGDYTCDCDSCRLARGQRVEDGKQGLDS